MTSPKVSTLEESDSDLGRKLIRKALEPLVYYQWKKDAPKDVNGRLLDWDHILHYIAMEQRSAIGDLIVDWYLDLFADEDHQVELVDGVLRFKQVAYYQSLGINHLNLNKLKLGVCEGKIPVEHFNQLLRDIGYSLAGYCDARVNPVSLLDDDGQPYLLDDNGHVQMTFV